MIIYAWILYYQLLTFYFFQIYKIRRKRKFEMIYTKKEISFFLNIQLG